MPAMGQGDSQSDADIKAATEYMLSRTYPELPVDW